MSSPEQALLLAARLSGRDPAALAARAPFPVLASPGWHGVDSIHWRISGGGPDLHLKQLHPDSRHHVDPVASFKAAVQAGKAGVGPAILAADTIEEALLLEAVTDAVAATLHELHDPRVFERAWQVRKAFQETAPLGRPVSVFDEIRDVTEKAQAAAASLPADLPWLLANLAMFEQAVNAAGMDLVPAHGDGQVSNLLVRPDRSVLLVDFDRAADMDPFADLGSLMVEVCGQEPEARALFEAWHGSMDETLFARTMLYGVADDLRWALLGFLLAKVTLRPELEFLKFANWRLLRCRMAMREPRFAERVRRV